MSESTITTLDPHTTEDPIDEPQSLAAPLTVLYQDEYLIAVEKPGGMLVHRSFLDKEQSRYALQAVRDQIGQRVYPVHRLDRPTCGILVFALSSDIARKLSEQNQQAGWQKGYLAVVRGYLKDAGELDYPLVEQLDKIADKFAQTNKAAQTAITRYQPLLQVELPYSVSRYPSTRYSLIALQPITGRKHQLRRHMAHLRHPIVGDTTHGDGKHNMFFRQQLDCQRLLLCAFILRFTHPVTAEPILLQASLAEFQDVFSALNWPTDPTYYLEHFNSFLETN